VAEVASGVNENRRGLRRIVTQARRGSFDVPVIEYNGRLARFGYPYLEVALGIAGSGS
jgi:predicted site-specific integrase-resolvase